MENERKIEENRVSEMAATLERYRTLHIDLQIYLLPNLY